MIDELGDPLIHLVRNAIDHGLESADALGNRPASRKREPLSSKRPIAETVCFISIRDDGAGISVERVSVNS